MTTSSDLQPSSAPKTKVHHVEIDASNVGQRIDNYLMTYLKGVPKTYIYRIIRKGEVRINKGRIKPVYKLVLGDVVRIPPVRVADAKIAPEAKYCDLQRLKQAIIFEDKSLIVLNKPAGMAVHGGSGISFGVIETLRKLYPQEKRLELVHRLDRDTSGCLLIA
ncbi:MAG TPA: 23S rRNA pseudouridine(955/2504/2580) synthase, partial [Gammaproteobacteria bacterium]|nr:23S rRNA pseudouridine(955/2504/2580) synthase [Gammaproteobacteria bacterium]